MGPTLMIVAIVAFALIYDLTNGWNDSANAIATVVSTRVLSPAQAILFGAGLNFAGALFSSEVAKTVGKDIADPRLLTSATFLAAVIIAPIWITFCTWYGLPISCSHSLMGGLIGSVLATTGVAGLEAKGIKKIIFGACTSPFLGFAFGALIFLAILWLCRGWSPSVVGRWFGKLQLFSAGAMAFSHGTGDAQKAMGIITGALISANLVALGPDGEMEIPLWVRLACATMMAVGTAVGGWRVMRTLGSRLAHLKPHHGFAAETAAATTILLNTLTGVPISTTHSITGAIMGVGAVQGVKVVKWGIGAKIVFAWIVTFPVCIGGGAALFLLFERIGLV